MKNYRFLIILFLVVLLSFGMVLPVFSETVSGPVSGEGMVPVHYDVNENHLVRAGAPVGGCLKFKIDPPHSGTYNIPGTKYSVTVTFNQNGSLVDWSSENFLVDHVYVKGGRGGGGNLYSYKPAADEDTGLGVNAALQQISHVTFFYCEPEVIVGSIEGLKFKDLNADGIYQLGENEYLLSGWTIYLYDNSAMTNLVDFDMTGADGIFSFTNLPLNTYYLREEMTTDQEVDWFQTAPVSPNYYVVTLNTSNPHYTLKSTPTLHFGNAEYGSICGAKFVDVNKDGNYEGEDGDYYYYDEVGEKGWTIFLYKWAAAELRVDETWIKQGSVETDEGGQYCFTNLLPGRYKIAEEQRMGWEQSAPKDSDYYNNDDGYFYDVVLKPGDRIVSKIFGNYEEKKEEIKTKLSVYKFRDNNRNGIWDSGESEIDGWKVSIEKSDGEGGWSSYSNITTPRVNMEIGPGTYRLTEETRSGWTPTTAASVTVTLEQGDSKKVEFGNYYSYTPPNGDTTTLVVRKFHDTNKNGIWDAGEPEIRDWKVFINDVEYSTPVNRTVSPGTYTITEKTRAGWQASTATSAAVTLSYGESKTVTFGNYEVPPPPPPPKSEKASLKVLKFNDANENGIWDEGEMEIKGWKVIINGTEYATPVNISLEPGTYTITEETRDGWTASTDTTQVVTLEDGDSKTVKFGNFEEVIVPPDKPDTPPEKEDDPKLPETGSSALLFTGLGALLVGVGVFFRRRRQY